MQRKNIYGFYASVTLLNSLNFEYFKTFSQTYHMYASCFFHENILVVSSNNKMKCTHNFCFAYGRFSSLCIFLFPVSLTHVRTSSWFPLRYPPHKTALFLLPFPKHPPLCSNCVLITSLLSFLHDELVHRYLIQRHVLNCRMVVWDIQ